jgi:hypothetical protein
VIPSALVEKYLLLQAPAPRVCGRSEPESSLGEKATRPSHWMGNFKRLKPHHNQVRQTAQFSASTPPLYRCILKNASEFVDHMKKKFTPHKGYATA